MPNIDERLIEIASRFIERERYSDTGACTSCGAYLDKIPHDKDCLVAEWDRLMGERTEMTRATKTTITRLGDVIELSGQGNIRKALAFYVLAFEQLRQEAFKNGVHTNPVKIGGFCELHDIVFYGNNCPFCISVK